jgi:hypothetical protein
MGAERNSTDERWYRGSLGPAASPEKMNRRGSETNLEGTGGTSLGGTPQHFAEKSGAIFENKSCC